MLLAAGCNDNGEAVVPCDGSLELKLVEASDAVESQYIGAVTVNATGGIGPYRFSLDGQEFVQGSTFQDLPGGTYEAMVMDQNGCTASASVFIKEQSVVSYRLAVAPVIEANCNIPLCHCNGNSLCFEEYAEVVRNQVQIGQRTAQRAMPPDYSGKRLTDTEIENISNWIYQGAQTTKFVSAVGSRDSL